MSIYQEIILEHYRNPQNHGHIENPTKSVTVNNPLCGDILTMEVLVDGDMVRDIKFDGEGCAISIASASLLTEKVKQHTWSEAQEFTPDTVKELLGIELSPNRLKCALLPLEALKKLL